MTDKKGSLWKDAKYKEGYASYFLKGNNDRTDLNDMTDLEELGDRIEATKNCISFLKGFNEKQKEAIEMLEEGSLSDLDQFVYKLKRSFYKDWVDVKRVINILVCAMNKDEEKYKKR